MQRENEQNVPTPGHQNIGAEVNRSRGGEKEARLRWVHVTSPDGTYQYTSEMIAMTVLRRNTTKHLSANVSSAQYI